MGSIISGSTSDIQKFNKSDVNEEPNFRPVCKNYFGEIYPTKDSTEDNQSKFEFSPTTTFHGEYFQVRKSVQRKDDDILFISSNC